MKMHIEVPTYDPAKGITYQWEANCEIKVSLDNNTVLLTANREGLLSLANHLLNLAQQEVPAGHHMHFDEHNSLAEGSISLIIEKK